MSPVKTPGTPKETRFPDWVPEPAQRRITELFATPLGMHDLGHALLERLSSYEVMKTEVWGKLPSEPRGIEGSIIDWAFFAFTIFPNLRRPYPKTAAKWREWAKHIAKHPPLKEPADVSWSALQLWEDIYKLKSATEFYWSRLWEGDKSITLDQVLTILDQVRLFYVRMHQEHQAQLALLPKVKQWNAKAAQKFFTDYLSFRITETYSQPLDTIVAALAEVAFDLPGGVAAETVRGRRRLITAPEKTKQKSR